MWGSWDGWKCKMGRGSTERGERCVKARTSPGRTSRLSQTEAMVCSCTITLHVHSNSPPTHASLPPPLRCHMPRRSTSERAGPELTDSPRPTVRQGGEDPPELPRRPGPPRERTQRDSEGGLGACEGVRSPSRLLGLHVRWSEVLTILPLPFSPHYPLRPLLRPPLDPTLS